MTDTKSANSPSNNADEACGESLNFSEILSQLLKNGSKISSASSGVIEVGRERTEGTSEGTF